MTAVSNPLTFLLLGGILAARSVCAGVTEPPVVKVPDGQRLDMQVQVADLGFLTGAWTGSDGESEWETSYTTAAGGQLLGASKEMRGGRVVMIDFEHFYEREGAVLLRPYPFGKASVEFALTRFDAAARTAVFENPGHDFPKRFTYRRASEERLEIELVGEMNGEPLAVNLDLRRTAR